MSMRIPAERIRPNLTQTYRTLQALSWVIGSGFIAALLFADPDHRLLRAALAACAALVNAILR